MSKLQAPSKQQALVGYRYCATGYVGSSRGELEAERPSSFIASCRRWRRIDFFDQRRTARQIWFPPNARPAHRTQKMYVLYVRTRYVDVRPTYAKPPTLYDNYVRLSGRVSCGIFVGLFFAGKFCVSCCDDVLVCRVLAIYNLQLIWSFKLLLLNSSPLLSLRSLCNKKRRLGSVRKLIIWEAL
jgi:hypothetical protein